MNGANLGITDEFGLRIQRPEAGQRSTRDLWVFGFLNAVPFLAGGVLSAFHRDFSFINFTEVQNRTPFFSDVLQEWLLGRRGIIAAACLVSIAATIGQSFSRSIAQIIGCRIITGLTLAAKASSAPLLTAEVAPNHLRGKKLPEPG